MDKSMIKGMTIGSTALAILAGGTFWGYKALSEPELADVVAVREVTETVITPREECRNVPVRSRAPDNDPARITGTVIGGIAGGVLGNQIGRGSDRAAATIVGAAGGAFVGNRVQDSMQQSNVVTTTKRSCRTAYDKSEKLVGYDVTYRLEDKEGVVRTPYRPGATLPVEKGQVVVTPPVATQ